MQFITQYVVLLQVLTERLVLYQYYKARFGD